MRIFHEFKGKDKINVGILLRDSFTSSKEPVYLRGREEAEN
jgi:hypothetical protein